MADLRLQALVETAQRAHAGSFLHLPLWLLVGWTSGLAQAETLFFWVNVGLFAGNLGLRLLTFRRIQRNAGPLPPAAERTLVALLLTSAFHWGALCALAIAWPAPQAVQTSLFLTAIGVAAGGTMGLCLLQPVRVWYPLLCIAPAILTVLVTQDAGHAFEAFGALLFFAYIFHASSTVQADYWSAARARAELEDRARQLELLSTTDSLTGIQNRMYFDHRLVAEWSRAARAAHPLSMLIVDVDHFKRVNDTHGHAVGDRCLVAVAQALRASLHRPTDVLARYGGEEFAALLPMTDQAGAARVADSLRRSVAEIEFTHDGQTIPLTCSVGVQTVTPAPGANAAVAMQQADAALYVAKREGRNRVAVAEPPGPHVFSGAKEAAQTA